MKPPYPNYNSKLFFLNIISLSLCQGDPGQTGAKGKTLDSEYSQIQVYAFHSQTNKHMACPSGELVFFSLHFLYCRGDRSDRNFFASLDVRLGVLL